jgi:hypothetical protein
MESNEEEARPTHEGYDDSEPEQVTARARLRMAELLERPFDIRSLALTGLFILAVFYTIYYLRSVLLPSDCARTRQDQNSDTSRRRPHPNYAAYRNHTGDFGAGDAGRRLAGESAGWLARTGVQASSNEAIDGPDGESQR